MTLSSLLVSRDWQEIGVLECILGGLHMDVEVETEPARALVKLSKSKIDALIVDCDLRGSDGFLRSLESDSFRNSVPLVLVSGPKGRKSASAKGAAFFFEKPISVEQAVRTLSAARNMVVEGRLRYHRQSLDFPVAVKWGPNLRLKAQVLNLSQGGLGIVSADPLPENGTVQVSFALPGSKKSLKLKGEIAWRNQHGHAGIKFVEREEQTRRNLKIWLDRRYFAH